MELVSLLSDERVGFRTQDEVRPAIRSLCRKSDVPAEYHEIGTSENGRTLYAVVMGTGAQTVSLMAGAHSDEPVGPETLRTLVLQGLTDGAAMDDLLRQYTLVVLPHINPDGEAENRAWIKEWPDAAAYLRHRFRELPGRDLEFGYPSMRPENRAVASFLELYAPFTLHMSLHGMGVSEGGLLLIERHWIDRTEDLRSDFRELVGDHGLGLHDHDRGGEKGFVYIGPGFSTTPEGQAMTRHFLDRGDEETADKFHLSSMEYVRSLGGDPLSLVTEFPLYVIGRRDPNREPGQPVTYLEFRDRLAELTEKARRGESLQPVLEAYEIRPLPLAEAKRLQLETIASGLRAVGRSKAEEL